jgi:hypothetical protein
MENKSEPEVNEIEPKDQHPPGIRPGHEIYQSFDARDWARDFVAHVRAYPGIPLDEECMATWFANALMRGYDEGVGKVNQPPAA